MLRPCGCQPAILPVSRQCCLSDQPFCPSIVALRQNGETRNEPFVRALRLARRKLQEPRRRFAHESVPGPKRLRQQLASGPPGRFALGGAGLVFAEATAVEADGRRTHGDLGLWEDGQIEALRPVTEFLEAEGAVPGIQLGHAGRKASERRPWHGETPVTAEDETARGESPWTAMAPSALPYAEGWPTPVAMGEEDIERVIRAFGEAARRALEAGFKVIEVYAAHGFLVHQFLSPIANLRTDRWGGDASGRRRFAVAVARSIRAHWPENLPLIFSFQRPIGSMVASSPRIRSKPPVRSPRKGST